MAVKKLEVDGYTVKVMSDDHPWNPREWDNLGTMVCGHRRYRLGNVQVQSAEELREAIPETALIQLPLFLYDHSGISL